MTKSYLGKSQSQKYDLVLAQFILNLNFWRNTEDLKTPISQKSWIGSDFEFELSIEWNRPSSPSLVKNKTWRAWLVKKASTNT